MLLLQLRDRPLQPDNVVVLLGKCPVLGDQGGMVRLQILVGVRQNIPGQRKPGVLQRRVGELDAELGGPGLLLDQAGLKADVLRRDPVVPTVRLLQVDLQPRPVAHEGPVLLLHDGVRCLVLGDRRSCGVPFEGGLLERHEQVHGERKHERGSGAKSEDVSHSHGTPLSDGPPKYSRPYCKAEWAPWFRGGGGVG